MRPSKLRPSGARGHPSSVSEVLAARVRHSSTMATSSSPSHGYDLECQGQEVQCHTALVGVPELFREPAAFLLYSLLTVPPVSKDAFLVAVQRSYNLAFTQSLLRLSLQVTPSERQAWLTEAMAKATLTSSSATPSTAVRQPVRSISSDWAGLASGTGRDSLHTSWRLGSSAGAEMSHRYRSDASANQGAAGECVRGEESKGTPGVQEMAFLLHSLGSTGLYSKEDSQFLTSVLSDEAIRSHLLQQCLPLLEFATGLASHMIGLRMPQVSGKDESSRFALLTSHLGLPYKGVPSAEVLEELDVAPLSPRWEDFSLCDGTSTPRTEKAAGVSGMAGEQCATSALASAAVSWTVHGPYADLGVVVTAWCEALHPHILRKRDLVKDLCERAYVPRGLSPPALIDLPRQYQPLFDHYRQLKCSHCHAVPQSPSVCLVCGKRMCFKYPCCPLAELCAEHGKTCGAGTCVSLSVHGCYVIVMRGPRVGVWGSIYLDKHGEEDRELKRGHPLYLSTARYAALQDQYILHAFDRTCKRWVMHKDDL